MFSEKYYSQNRFCLSEYSESYLDSKLVSNVIALKITLSALIAQSVCGCCGGAVGECSVWWLLVDAALTVPLRVALFKVKVSTAEAHGRLDVSKSCWFLLHVAPRGIVFFLSRLKSPVKLLLSKTVNFRATSPTIGQVTHNWVDAASSVPVTKWTLTKFLIQFAAVNCAYVQTGG